MKFKLEFEMDNAAFFEIGGLPNQSEEIARILRDTALRLEPWGPMVDGDNGGLRDCNGNTVGEWRVTK